MDEIPDGIFGWIDCEKNSLVFNCMRSSQSCPSGEGSRRAGVCILAVFAYFADSVPKSVPLLAFCGTTGRNDGGMYSALQVLADHQAIESTQPRIRSSKIPNLRILFPQL